MLFVLVGLIVGFVGYFVFFQLPKIIEKRKKKNNDVEVIEQ